MDSSAVDRILDFLVPGLTKSEPDYVSGSISGSYIRAAEKHAGIWLYRGLERKSAKTLLLDASLRADPGCLPETRYSLESRYGKPEYEQFTAMPGLTVSISYDSGHTVTRVDFDKTKALLDDDSKSGALDENVVEQLIKEFISPAQRTPNPIQAVSQSGPDRSDSVEYDRVVINRTRHADDLIHASVKWK